MKYTDYYDHLKELEYPVVPYSEHPHGDIGWKGKMVYASPDKFLSLARKLEHPRADSLTYLRDKMLNGEKLDYLILFVDMNKKKVTGHEGRHRATIARELGIKKVPIFVYTGNSYARTPEWTKKDHDIVDNLKFSPEA